MEAQLATPDGIKIPVVRKDGQQSIMLVESLLSNEQGDVAREIAGIDPNKQMASYSPGEFMFYYCYSCLPRGRSLKLFVTFVTKWRFKKNVTKLSRIIVPLQKWEMSVQSRRHDCIDSR